MIKDPKKFMEHYEKLYEELKKKYENKEKENDQLKTLLKLRDKEIISLKTKIKSLNNNHEENYANNNYPEISKKFLENLIKNEMENIKKELLLYRNKILTLENYELQYLAPKLTTGSNNNNYQYSSNKLLNKSVNYNDKNDKLYLNMKKDKSMKNRLYHNILKSDSNSNNDIFNSNLDYKYNNIDNFNKYEIGENFIINDQLHKTLTKSKRHYDI